MQINNEIYNEIAHIWWADDEYAPITTLRYWINPVRFSYFQNILSEKIKANLNHKTILDVGCGGGFLSEAFAQIGLNVSGIDPSRELINAAKRHAVQKNLNISYFEGFGEKLPFESNVFDFVCCCDVLEHVKDVKQVIREISRVLKNNGIFFFDTINRTFVSKLIMIKIGQEWEKTALGLPGLHVWDMFIKPKELVNMMKENKLDNREMKGLSPGMNYFAHVMNIIRYQKGSFSIRELGKRFKFHISRDLSCAYLGYAIKNTD